MAQQRDTRKKVLEVQMFLHIFAFFFFKPLDFLLCGLILKKCDSSQDLRPKRIQFFLFWEELAFITAIFNKEGFFFYPLWAPDPRLQFTVASTQECLPGMLLAENSGKYGKKFLRYLVSRRINKV